ncbi:MAG: DUF1385 domain-containing protein [Firmicutes bacterium]|nr:DUF1385 domain-containing protein [Bacillota bacterium]
MKRKGITVGGQAVMEGVMMRGRKQMAIAVRQPDGQVVVEVRPNWRLVNHLPFMALPFLRGVAAFIEALVVGIDAILYSANASQPDDVQLGKGEAVFATVLGLSLGVLLFMLLPTFVIQLLSPLGMAPLWLNLVEGLLRMAIFLSYMLAVSLLPDMRRFFQYHGAEHKAIHTFEAGEALEVANLRQKRPEHPRCGAAFLLLVMLVSIVTFSFFGWPDLKARLLTRLALLPVVAGIAYELSRLAARSADGGGSLGLIMGPALLLQRATTREPDDDQMEVAIAALQGLLDVEPDLAPY